jgi:hypothetical protein
MAMNDNGNMTQFRLGRAQVELVDKLRDQAIQGGRPPVSRNIICKELVEAKLREIFPAPVLAPAE